jgi:hypothetical protein
MKMISNAKKGYALPTTIGIITIMGTIFTMLMMSGQQSIFAGKRIVNRAKATAYAEAGIEFAYSILRNNFDERTNTAAFRLDTSGSYAAGDALLSSYGQGTFTLRLIPVSNQYVIVNSIGNCGKSEVEVEVLVEDAHYVDYDEFDAFNNAITAGGGGAFGGGGADIGNPELLIHVNGPVTVNGSIDVDVSIASTEEIDLKNKTINGAAYAPDISSNGTATGGKHIQAVPPVAIPDIDLHGFYLHAQNNSEVYTAVGSEYQIKNDYAPAGGVMFIDGDVKIYANVTGTIIATGNITIVSGGVKENGSGIAMATETGDILNKSTGDSEGLIYSRTGSYSMQASQGTVTGQIIVGGSATQTGGNTLIFAVTPPDEEFLEAYPVISAWQK